MSAPERWTAEDWRKGAVRAMEIARASPLPAAAWGTAGAAVLAWLGALARRDAR